MDMVKNTFSLAEMLLAVETAGDEVVPGTCHDDIRDAVVILAGKVSKCKRVLNWGNNQPRWTQREMWAADLVIKAYAAELTRRADGRGR